MLLSKSRRLRTIALAAQTVNVVALKALWKNPSQGRAIFNRYFHTYLDLVKGGEVPWSVKSIFEAFPEAANLSITLEHKPGGGIATNVKQLAYLAIITKALAPKRIFEIGTFRGRTALNFALNSPPDCEVFTLDLPVDNHTSVTHTADRQLKTVLGSKVGCEFKGHPSVAKIRQLWGDSMTFDFTPFAHTVDLVYVDGAHHYQAVLSDTHEALGMLRKSGRVAILWDDFGNFGDYFDVVAAILDSPVKSAVFQLEDTELAVYLREGVGS